MMRSLLLSIPMLAIMPAAYAATGTLTSEGAFDKLMQEDARAGMGGMNALLDVSKEKIGVKISVPALASAFNDNGLSTDQKYGGKPIIVDGQFEGARRGVLDQPYVLLGDGFAFGHQAQLFIEPEAVEEASSLHPGEKASLLCGGAEGGIGNTLAKDCVFYDDYSAKIAMKVSTSVRQWLDDGTQSLYIKDSSKQEILLCMH